MRILQQTYGFLLSSTRITDFIDRRVHPAFHIAGVVVSAVVINSFIMNKTGRVHLPVQLGHFKNNFSANDCFRRTRSESPDGFVSLIHRITRSSMQSIHSGRRMVQHRRNLVSYGIRISRSMHGTPCCTPRSCKDRIHRTIINADRIRIM